MQFIKARHRKALAAQLIFVRGCLAQTARAAPWPLSGVLAAAHLCGADSVVAFLRCGTDAADEFTTILSSYMLGQQADRDTSGRQASRESFLEQTLWIEWAALVAAIPKTQAITKQSVSQKLCRRARKAVQISR
jgi:hypothetical protein